MHTATVPNLALMQGTMPASNAKRLLASSICCAGTTPRCKKEGLALRNPARSRVHPHAQLCVRTEELKGWRLVRYTCDERHVREMRFGLGRRRG